MKIRLLIVIALISGSYVFGDTFKNTKSGESFVGYPTDTVVGEKTKVMTPDGEKLVNLTEYDVTYDYNGRNAMIPVLSIPDAIMLQMETDAFIEAMKEEANKGPYFVLIEIDSPGGRVDYTKLLCDALINLKHCKTVAYITGGSTGGAYSAAAIVSLACNEICMAKNSVMGAATTVLITEKGLTDAAEVMGEDVSEKIRSANRNYFASIAESNNRSGIMAKAMEDKDIEVVEVIENGKRVFIDGINMRPDHQKVKIWSKKGSLLTLTATEAVECGMANRLVTSRQDVLEQLEASGAQVTVNMEPDEARELYKKVEAKFKKLDAAIAGGINQLGQSQNYRFAVRATRELIVDVKQMIMLKRRFDQDIPYEESDLEGFLEQINSYYESLKSRR